MKQRCSYSSVNLQSHILFFLPNVSLRRYLVVNVQATVDSSRNRITFCAMLLPFWSSPFTPHHLQLIFHHLMRLPSQAPENSLPAKPFLFKSTSAQKEVEINSQRESWDFEFGFLHLAVASSVENSTIFGYNRIWSQADRRFFFFRQPTTLCAAGVNLSTIVLW